MTFLTACQSAAVKLVGKKPSVFFSGTDTFSLEICDLANEVAEDIAKSHDWQALISTHVITGDGAQTSFPLPADYDRMPMNADLFDVNNWAWRYTRVVNASDWLRLDIERFTQITPGWWTIIADQFQFVPAPAGGNPAKFVYIKAGKVTAADGTTKQSFTKDDDTFALSERLLMLGIVWKWREQKRQEASTDQANFQKAFDELASRDKGARILVGSGGSRMRGDVYPAYPRPLGV